MSIAIRAFRLPWVIVRGMHLGLKLADGGHERVEVEQGHSLNDELDLFLHRQGKYETGWVPIGGGASYVRYEQVAEVRPVA